MERLRSLGGQPAALDRVNCRNDSYEASTALNNRPQLRAWKLLRLTIANIDTVYHYQIPNDDSDIAPQDYLERLFPK